MVAALLAAKSATGITSQARTKNESVDRPSMETLKE